MAYVECDRTQTFLDDDIVLGANRVLGLFVRAGFRKVGYPCLVGVVGRASRLAR